MKTGKNGPRSTLFDVLNSIGVITLIFLSTLCFCTACENKQLIKIGDDSIKISGTDSHGALFSLDQFKGRVVVLYFWTNSCCGARLKLMETFYRQNKDKGLEILAVNVGDSREIVSSYAKTNELSFTLLTDERSITSKQYGIFGFPTVFVLDRNGVIREKIHGDIPVDILQKLVTKRFDIQKKIESDFEKIHPR